MIKIEPRFDVSIIDRVSEKTSNGHDSDGIVSILLLNDNYSCCSYVVFCLIEVDFGLSHQEADNTMRIAHTTGDALVGIYTRDRANELLKQVQAVNQKCGENLQFQIVE